MKNFKAIDLYGGIGGWTLGLQMVGIEVLRSYENWMPAIETHNANFGHLSKPIDIRKLSISDLPSDIDFIVGSPPCTQFSYSNRGGSGNINDGLVDIRKFLQIVTANLNIVLGRYPLEESFCL